METETRGNKSKRSHFETGSEGPELED